jgi:hypothetical protein
MFKAIKEFFMGKPAVPVPEAPYKIEVPAFKPTADAAPVVGSAANQHIEATAPAANKKTDVAAKKIAAAKKPAAKKPAARKPAAKKPVA